MALKGSVVSRFCAFLRGVNVNGRKMLMRDVCSVFEVVELNDISSVLATGNILFSSDESADTLRPRLENELSDYCHTPVSLFLKDTSQISSIVAAIPFEDESAFHIYVFICEDGFENTLMREFNEVSPIEGEKAAISSGYFYWRVPKGSTLDAGFSKALGGKDTKNKQTSRNISTIKKVQERL